MLNIKRKNAQEDPAFEDSLSHEWNRDLTIAEVSIGNRPLFYLGAVIFSLVAIVAGRIIYLNWANGAYYQARATDNMAQYSETPAPRGVIYDREGDVLAESKAAFAAELDAREFITDPSLQTSTEAAVQTILNITPDALNTLVSQASAQDFATPIVLAENLTQTELVNLQSLTLPTIKVVSDFERDYPEGPTTAAIIGYTGRVSQADLNANPDLSSTDFIGKTGIEAYYDSTLQGKPGITVQYKDALGNVMRTDVQSAPQAGTAVHLTIDGGFQMYFASRLASGLKVLGRNIGFGIAIDPQNGQVLSLVNLPSYDDNLFSGATDAGNSGNGTSTAAAISALLTSPEQPLFDRAVSGYYNPGSTIKPLDGVAGLKDGVIDPTREIFSPGYLLVPNPYDASTPTKYLDWRYQGNVDLASALAQSSDVYFYEVGGGSPAVTNPLLNDPLDYGIGGLGITRLNTWWQTFGLGKPTGIDMPDESVGFLPTPAWKQQHSGTPWLLGDTYNVSIGQGDLLLSPFQLIDYIGAIANGGKIYKPFLNMSSTPQVAEDLTDLLPEIQQVQKGMVAGVATPLGTAYTLHDLPFSVCAKTGSAQVENNAEENALFVGYAPCNNPQIALLILIENSKDGSLNAVPIAKDVLNWYYQNRLANTTSTTP